MTTSEMSDTPTETPTPETDADELTAWLRLKLNSAEKALKQRRDMESTWQWGSDAAWKAVGCKKTKAQRLAESRMHGRIASKCLKDVEHFKALLVIVNQHGITERRLAVAVRALEQIREGLPYVNGLRMEMMGHAMHRADDTLRQIEAMKGTNQ